MRRLRERRSQDDLKNQPRARRQSIIRWLYLASVVHAYRPQFHPQ